MENSRYWIILATLVCLSTIALSGCGSLMMAQAYPNALKLQEERRRQALEAYANAQKQQEERMKQALEQQKRIAEEQKLLAEERKRIIEERMQQAQIQKKRQQEYDEWFRSLTKEQQYQLKLEEAKANRASVERGAAQWKSFEQGLKAYNRD